MKNLQKGALGVMVAIIVALLLAGAAYWQQQNKTTVSIDTSDWETYTDKQYGFEFKYPAEWIFNQGSGLSAIDQPYFTDNGDKIIVQVNIGLFDTIAYPRNLETHIKDRVDNYPGAGEPEKLSSEMLVNDDKALGYLTQWKIMARQPSGAADPIIVTRADFELKAVPLVVNPYGKYKTVVSLIAGEWGHPVSAELFKTIALSFKFTK